MPACGAGDPNELTATRRQAILGGWIDEWGAGHDGVVSLWENNNGQLQHACTGVLVTSQWVLTAAHCVMDPTLPIAQIRVGRNKNIPWSSSALDGYRVYTPAQCVLHPELGAGANASSCYPVTAYGGLVQGNRYHRDIALIRLNAPVPCADARPLRLALPVGTQRIPGSALLPLPQTARLEGYGQTSERRQLSVSLLSAQAVLGTPPMLHSMWDWAAIDANEGSLQGDSGGRWS